MCNDGNYMIDLSKLIAKYPHDLYSYLYVQIYNVRWPYIYNIDIIIS